MSHDSPWHALENRMTGERMLVLRRGRDVDGAVLEVQFDLPPHREGSPRHIHSHVVERFEVLEGALHMTVEGQSMTLLAGDAVEVSPGQAHSFANHSNAWVTFTTEIRSAGQFERFLRTWYGLANAGRTRMNGLPRNLFHLARCLQDADFHFVGIPAVAQDRLLGALVSIGRSVGAFSALRAFERVPSPSLEA